MYKYCQHLLDSNVSKAELYKWSSDIYYRKDIDSFIKTKVALKMLDKNKTKAIEKYIEFMNESEEENYSKINAIGDEAYIVMCSSKKEVKQRKELVEILKETGISEDDYNLIKSGSRKRRLTEYKLRYTKAAIAEHYTYAEIGRSICMTDSGIKDMLDRYEKIEK